MNSCVRSRSVSAQISQAKAAPHRVPSVRSTTIFQESTDPITAPTANTKMAAPGPPSPQRETMMVDAPAKSASSNTMATGGAPVREISDGRKTPVVSMAARKKVGQGRRVAVGEDHGGGRHIKK